MRLIKLSIILLLISGICFADTLSDVHCDSSTGATGFGASKEQYMADISRKMEENIRWQKYNQERKPGWAAGLWSYFIPGAGHFYCGDNLSGTVFAAGTIGSLVLMASSKSEATAEIGLIACLALRVGDIALAVIAADEYNESLKEKYNLVFSTTPKKDKVYISYVHRF
jgi:hypothetical protein